MAGADVPVPEGTPTAEAPTNVPEPEPEPEPNAGAAELKPATVFEPGGTVFDDLADDAPPAPPPVVSGQGAGPVVVEGRSLFGQDRRLVVAAAVVVLALVGVSVAVAGRGDDGDGGDSALIADGSGTRPGVAPEPTPPTTTTAPTTTTTPNRAPLAFPDTQCSVPGFSRYVANLDNDTDPDGDPLDLVAVATSAQGGTTRIVAPPEGVLPGRRQVVQYFVPATLTSGSVDTYSYTVADGRGGTSTAIATINIVTDEQCP